MAPSLPRLLASSCLALFFGRLASSAVVTHDFNITWTEGNPDGQANRAVIGINNQWPIPVINVNKGDRLVVNVFNGLGNESTSLHWHGIYQNGSTEMDGSPGATQCEIVPGTSFTYNFTIDQPGTYWYHSHTRGQYPDGLRGPLIVHDPDSPFKDDYDEEIILPFSDWYHEMMPKLISEQFLTVTNPTGAEPVPQSALVNNTQDLKVPLKPGKTYLVRMINMGAFAAQYVWFEGHTMRIVEVDGIYTEPKEAEMLYITAAQRYSVLITAKDDTSKNFAFVGSMDQDLFDAIPAGLNPNVTGWLTYDEEAEFPAASFVDEFDPFDDFTLKPEDGMEALGEPDYTVTLDLAMNNLGDGANYAFFNDITWVSPNVPFVFSALTTGDTATNSQIYGPDSNAHIFNKGDVVEIVLNNMDPGKHPFHLHGHAFQVVLRSEEEAGLYDNKPIDAPKAPMRRDTVLVYPNGHIVLRFVADNPGIWLFHCHIEWHMISGLAATFIEAPIEMQSSIKIPEDHYAACRAADTPTAGNAAGNTKDLLDLSGVNKSPAPLPAGFTARGIVALVFSVIAAFIGMAVIAWYGMSPLDSKTASGGAIMTEK